MAGGRTEMEFASVAVTVGNDNVSGIVLTTSKGATLTGTVTAVRDASAKTPNGVTVTMQPLTLERGFGAGSARVAPDGTFQLANLFGRGVIRVNGLPPDWMLKAVLIGGSDVTDSAIEFAPNGETRGVQILLTNRLTELTGTVAATDSQPIRDYTVVVFPEDPAKWTSPSRYVRFARPDQYGVFKIRSLPANPRYLAVAIDYLEDGETGDPEFFEQMKEVATKTALGDGESKTIDLTLIRR
jgi:hypothetical protein